MDGFGIDAIGQSDVSGAAKSITGHRQNLFFLGSGTKGLGIGDGRFNEKIKSTLRLDAMVTDFPQSPIQTLSILII